MTRLSPETAEKITSEVAPGVFIEVELRQTPKGRELAITGTTAHSAGQCIEAIADVTTFSPGWDAARRDRLIEVWRAWHLNGMNAGCVHQRATWALDTPIVFTRVSIDWDVSRAIEKAADKGNGMAAIKSRALKNAAIKPFAWVALTEAMQRAFNAAGFLFLPESEVRPFLVERAKKLHEGGMVAPKWRKFPLTVQAETKQARWVRPDEHPEGLLLKPCDVCGYKYGSAWLFEPLPEDVIAFVRALPTSDSDPAADPYDIITDRFMAANGVTFTATHEKAKAPKWGHGSAAQHWKIVLKRRGKTLTFDFWNSEHDTDEGRPLRAYSVLACLSSDSAYTNADEIAAELDVKPSDALRTARFARRLHNFFGESLAALQEIR